MSKKLAIIGAATGQLPLCVKAKEMGEEVYVFAWDKNAVCKPYADHFIPISITEKDRIADYCKQVGIDGVISNCSDVTAEVVSYITTKLHLPGVDYKDMIVIRNKFSVRKLAQTIPGLTPIHTNLGKETQNIIYPCIVKPTNGSSKVGVSYVENEEELKNAMKYVGTEENIVIEEYIAGHEISVETISSQGKHYIIQTTDKDSSGAPHFVELGHHQPAHLPSLINEKLRTVVPILLTQVGYKNGPAHIEFKYYGDKLYLIELNPRGGGDEISNTLVRLSSGHDYLRYIIEVALNEFSWPQKPQLKNAYAGIYFLCLQTKKYLPFFKKLNCEPWIIKKQVESFDLYNSTTNYDRNGYVIYQSDHKIELV